MGCHTWFSVPYKTDKREIIEIAQEYVFTTKYITKGHKKMYQFAIDNELIEPVCELASIETDCVHRENSEWILYKDIRDYSVEEYNKKHGTNYHKYDKFFNENDVIESYSDEPRIGGYPDKIIHSYDEMVEFMKTGFNNEGGQHYDFYFDEDRIEKAMEGIKQFFVNHPSGIITFG